MIRIKLDVKKIDKSFLFTGAKGIYCDLTLLENKEGKDQWDNDGFIVQDVGKENREKGIKGPIIGNWKHVGDKPAQPRPQQKPAQTQAEDCGDDSEIPF